MRAAHCLEQTSFTDTEHGGASAGAGDPLTQREFCGGPRPVLAGSEQPFKNGR